MSSNVENVECWKPPTLKSGKAIVDKICTILSDSVSDQQTTRNNINGNQLLTDEEAFLERISTFTIYLWSVKPRRISPSACARYGWSVIDRDLLQCTSCRKILSAQIPPVWSHELYNEAVNRLERSLKDNHHKYCPWPTNPSLGNYLRRVLFKRERAITDFLSRLQDLNEFGPRLPALSPNLPQPLSQEQLNASKLPLLSRHQYEAVVLALTGWMRIKSDVLLLGISCKWCLRRAELSWYVPASDLYQGSDEVKDHEHMNGSENIGASSTSSDECTEPKRKRVSKIEMRRFNPLEEHQNWCPWVEESSELKNQDKVESGWKILFDILSKHCHNIELHLIGDGNQVLKDPLVPRSTVLAAKRMMRDWIRDTAAQP